MRDSYTGERIGVHDCGREAPSRFKIRAEQLPAVEKLLAGGEIEYWPDSVTTSIDDEPPSLRINISRNSDAKLVQKLLDTVP